MRSKPPRSFEIKNTVSSALPLAVPRLPSASPLRVALLAAPCATNLPEIRTTPLQSANFLYRQIAARRIMEQVHELNGAKRLSRGEQPLTRFRD